MSKFMSKPTLTLAGLATFMTIALCASAHASEQFTLPQVDLAIKTNGEYHRVTEYVVPEDHSIGDGTIAYEGPGIESDKVAYRLYLDERSVLDVFGKKIPGPVLQNVGRGDDYHVMSDWGMDILKVGESLGAGGLGVYENGHFRMLGPARILKVEVLDEDPGTASFVVTHEGLTSDAGTFQLETQYSMRQNSRLLSVQAQSSGQVPAIAAGLVKHPDTVFLNHSYQDGPGWAYIATYGVQTLANDQLGLALFYQTSKVDEVVKAGSTIGVVFKNDQPIDYKVAAAWVGEPGGIANLNAFKAYLTEELAHLTKTDGSDRSD